MTKQQPMYDGYCPTRPMRCLDLSQFLHHKQSDGRSGRGHRDDFRTWGAKPGGHPGHAIHGKPRTRIPEAKLRMSPIFNGTRHRKYVHFPVGASFVRLAGC